MVVGEKLNPADPGGELVERSSGSGFGKCRGRTGRCKQKISSNHQLVLAVLHDRNITILEITVLSLPSNNIIILQKNCGEKKNSQ